MHDANGSQNHWPEWMDARAAARYLDLPLSTIRRLTRSGSIPHIKPSPRNTRYSKSALDEWASRTSKGGQ